MTQPTENDFTFNRAALHILGGAVAGFGARDGGEALERGVRVGTALQNSYLKEKQFYQNQQDSQRYNDLREKSMNLDMQYKQKRLDAMDQDTAGNDFLRRLDVLNKMTGGQSAGYRKDYISRATQPIATDGLTYPIDEKQAELIDSMTKGSETLADLNMLMYSMHEAENSDSVSVKKEAQFASKVLGMKHGISIVDTPNGKFIKTRHGSYPLAYESADKIRQAYENDVNSTRGKLEDIYRTRNTAASASQKHILKKISGMGLDVKQELQIAQQYSSEIVQNPVMARSMDIANSLDRLLSAKDPKFTQMEQAELASKFEKGNVIYSQDAQTGAFLVNPESLNEYINRFNGGEKVDVVDGMGVKGGMVPVDATLVQDLFNRSGLNNLSEKYTTESKSIAERRVREASDKMRSEFSMYQQQKIFDAELDVKKTVAKEEALTQAKRDRIKGGDWTGASPDEVMDSNDFNATERENFERELSTKMSQTFIQDNVSFIKKKYKEFTGNDFSGGVDEKGKPVPMELDTTVIRLIQDLPEFQKQFKDDAKSIDRLSKTVLRRMVHPERRKASRVIDANDRLQYKEAQNIAWSESIQNSIKEKNKKSQLDSILGE